MARGEAHLETLVLDAVAARPGSARALFRELRRRGRTEEEAEQVVPALRRLEDDGLVNRRELRLTKRGSRELELRRVLAVAIARAAG
jgi:DNA-binding PadR family transcriptional regulator